MTIIVKDDNFQEGTSFLIIIIFLMYHLLNLDIAKIAATYPKSQDDESRISLWSHHLLWFLKVPFSICFWVMVSVVFTIVFLCMIKYFICAVIKLDGNVFKEISNGKQSNRLLELSSRYEEEEEKGLITTRDILMLVLSFVLKRPIVFLSILVSVFTISLLIGIVLIHPQHMITKKNRQMNVRLYKNVILCFILFVSTLYTIVTNQQSIH
jgi:hypothetical protein